MIYTPDMSLFLDLVLALYSSYLVVKCIKTIARKPSSLTIYTILLIFVFNCLPIVLDLLVAKPMYNLFPWYSYFDIAANIEEVNIVYSLYIIWVLFCLHLNLSTERKISQEEIIVNKSGVFKGKRLIVVSLLPIILFVISGVLSSNPLAMFRYVSNSSRGFNDVFTSLSSSLELLGIFSITVWFFQSKEKKGGNIALLILYYFLIAWINGKRYIVVTQLLLFSYFFLNNNAARIKVPKIKLKWVLLGLLTVAFYFIYLIKFKVIGDITLNFLYLTYRIDFGRDDVTKFVIYKEIIEKNPILEFRGQTFLSALLFFIPRAIWPNKPYPHYRYLTSSLYNIGILDIPSGMTPSIFETSIANLGMFGGILFTPMLFLILLRTANRANSISRKALYLILLTALLTQSLDSIMIILLLLPAGALAGIFKSKTH